MAIATCAQYRPTDMQMLSHPKCRFPFSATTLIADAAPLQEARNIIVNKSVIVNGKYMPTMMAFFEA